MFVIGVWGGERRVFIEKKHMKIFKIPAINGAREVTFLFYSWLLSLCVEIFTEREREREREVLQRRFAAQVDSL